MFDTDELVINMGPQHPSTHGVLRVVLRLDGEKVVDADVVIGYLHRGIEKLSENRNWTQIVLLTDRMDYVAAATNNATSLKASAGQLYGASVYNNAGYPVYLKFYNKATAPAPASDTVVFEIPAQAGTEREFHSDEGLAFGTGIAYALVKGISDTDNTSVAATDATVDLIYK